jgi:hypothetical protein
MPPNKKKVRNKKASAAARQPSISNPLSSLQNKKVAPDDTEKSKSNGLYSMYKEATLRFHHWMSWEACLNLRMTAVDDYRKGLQLILDRNRKAYLKEETENFVITPPEIMTSLASSIRLREKVTSEIFGSKDGGDVGHQYIIDVLRYCHGALQFANRMAAAFRKGMPKFLRMLSVEGLTL